MGGNEESGMNYSPLMDAALRGNTLLVEKLIVGNADIAKQGKQRMSALHLAARSGHAKVAQVLLDSLADVMQESQCGNALQLARKNGGVELLNVFGVQSKQSVEDERVTSIVSLDAAQRAAL